MALEKDDLGLSLSLSFPASAGTGAADGAATVETCIPTTRFQPKSPSAAEPASASSLPASHQFAPRCGLQKISLTDALAAFDRSAGDVRPFLGGIDVNRQPGPGECEEEAGRSSPNSTLSSVSGKRSEGDANGEGDDVERACSRGISDDEDGENSRKKLRLSKDQSVVLEESFKEHHTLNPKQKQALAKRLNLRQRQVEVWFQNRRARTKFKQTEVECDLLRGRWEDLTAENRRLQREVQELRALKFSPKSYGPMSPPTTLTMCPSCRRVAGPPSSAQKAHTPMAPLPFLARVPEPVGSVPFVKPDRRSFW